MHRSAQVMHENDILRIQALLRDQTAEIRRLLDDECAVAAAYNDRISGLENDGVSQYASAAAMVDSVVGAGPSLDNVHAIDSSALERIVSSLKLRESSVVAACDVAVQRGFL